MTPNKTVAFHTLGCKLNFAETSAIARQFLLKGYEKVSFEQAADVYVINTCSVTENADRECRQIIRKAKKINPFSKVVVIGCYAQLQPESIASIQGVDLICGTHDKFKVAELLEHLDDNDGHAAIYVNNIDKIDFYAEAYSIGDRTRTFLKVQDGCDYNCAFCTIPMARGRSRSSSIASVLQQAIQIANRGIKEIVLTGVNIGDFGKGPEGGKRANEQFLDLIKALDEVEGIYRFRISSIEPNLLSNEIIEFVAQSKRFMPHFHIPLQSGSNKILKLMRRRYQRELYQNRIQYIRQLMPHSCIGADVITGFAGETNNDFMETFHFINELEISYLHVFTYSERPGTIAASMKNAVPLSERKKRTAMLRSLSDKKRRYFHIQHQGTIRPVLFESDKKGAHMYGFTDNYIKVKTEYDSTLSNQIVNVLLSDLDHDGMLAIKSAHETSAITDN